MVEVNVGGIMFPGMLIRWNSDNLVLWIIKRYTFLRPRTAVETSHGWLGLKMLKASIINWKPFVDLNRHKIHTLTKCRINAGSIDHWKPFVDTHKIPQSTTSQNADWCVSLVLVGWSVRLICLSLFLFPAKSRFIGVPNFSREVPGISCNHVGPLGLNDHAMKAREISKNEESTVSTDWKYLGL